ncbi:expressed unknown protein [Seminavis robusta]|uniref:Uncharacterized protein n=1 Tax=Seminavis robusta TaxID=568900 RepID=A0A9N8DCZ1_9STRA|nr:expressed unknown protein [Seminavis robusta]|eukprot:Sro97_g049810.1 n/a (866) ;mRNA; f:11041-13638
MQMPTESQSERTTGRVEPGALAVNPSSSSSKSLSHSILTDVSASTSQISLMSNSSSSGGRRTQRASSSIPQELMPSSSPSPSSSQVTSTGNQEEQTMSSSMAEPPQVGAYAMRNSAVPVVHKLQTIPAGSQAALSRQAHKAPRPSLVYNTSDASSSNSNSRSTGTGTLKRHSSKNRNSASSVSLHHQARLDQEAKWGDRLSRQSLLPGIIGTVTNEVDVDDLILHVQQETDKKRNLSRKGAWSSRPRIIPSDNGHGTGTGTADTDHQDRTLQRGQGAYADEVERGLSATNMVSAHLVVEEDPEASHITVEERNEIVEQAQREAEEAVHEKMMRDMVLAEAVVEEDDGVANKRRRRHLCCGAVLLIMIFLGGALAGSQPWNRSDHDSHDMGYIPPPANNLCTDAIAMKEGTDSQFQKGTTLGATDSKFPSCNSRDGDEFTWGMGSVWYSIVGTGQALRVSSDAHTMVDENNQTVVWSTEISVFAGECGMLSCVGTGTTEAESSSMQNIGDGNDEDTNVSFTWYAETGVQYFVCVHGDAPEEMFTGFSEEVTQDMMAAGGIATLIEEVNGNNNSTSPGVATAGNFSLAVDVAVGNDFCPGAVDLALGPGDATVIQGSTKETTLDADFEFCAGTESTAGGVWYRVIGTGNPLEVRVDPEKGFNTQVTVFEQSGKDTMSCNLLDCIDGDSEAFQHSSHVTWPSKSGSAYYILVHGVSGAGDFELTLTQTVSNDVCEGAVSLESTNSTTSNRVEGTTEGASLVAPLAVCGHAVHTGAGVWHRVEGTGELMQVSTCDMSMEDATRVLDNTVVSVFRGEDCANLECIDGDDSSCGTHGAVTWESEVGQMYHILVSGKFEDVGAFQLSWGTAY